MEEVQSIEPAEVPLAEIPGRERLGTLINRFRRKANKTILQVSEATGIDETTLGKAESFEIPLDARQLQDIAAFLGVQWHPLLDVVRDFHRAVWSGKGNEGGVQLESMDTKVSSLAKPLDADAEKMLIKAADDLLFMGNVCRDVSDRAIASAVQIRTMLSDRGVIPADAALELLDNPKVDCAACGVIIDRNLEPTVSFQPDGGGPALFFSSRECADKWRAGDTFTCERSGREVQTSAPEEASDDGDD